MKLSIAGAALPVLLLAVSGLYAQSDRWQQRVNYTMLTVSYQSVRTALMNPVKSLRVE